MTENQTILKSKSREQTLKTAQLVKVCRCSHYKYLVTHCDVIGLYQMSAFFFVVEVFQIKSRMSVTIKKTHIKNKSNPIKSWNYMEPK